MFQAAFMFRYFGGNVEEATSELALYQVFYFFALGPKSWKRRTGSFYSKSWYI
jgi:hypothetical protein